MAVKTWYINEIGGDLFYDGDASGVAETLSLTGWTVGKTAAARYSDLLNGTERAANTFGTAVLPNNTAPTVNITQTNTPPYTPPNLLVSNQCVGFLYEYNGYFPAGDWIFNFPLRAQTNGGTQDGRMGLRVFKAARSGDTFTGTTELTSARIAGTTVTNLTTTTTQTSTVTWSAPAFFLNNEFLLAKIAWEITGQANNNNADVRLMYGSTATVISPTFRKRSYNITAR